LITTLAPAYRRATSRYGTDPRRSNATLDVRTSCPLAHLRFVFLVLHRKSPPDQIEAEIPAFRDQDGKSFHHGQWILGSCQPSDREHARRMRRLLASMIEVIEINAMTRDHLAGSIETQATRDLR
jgi:hypothetical protein